MAYQPTEWKARTGIGLNRFRILSLTDTHIELENDPISIEEMGTSFTVEWLNKIEEEMAMLDQYYVIHTVSYTVIFSNNNGNGAAPDSMFAPTGSPITLPDVGSMVKPGYTFGGWNTNTSGTGTHYNAGATFIVTQNITLYAVWIINYTVTFNANGGSGAAPTALTTVAGSPVTIPGAGSVTKTNYTFAGWNTNTSGTGTNYSTGASYTPAANITLYAKWVIEGSIRPNNDPQNLMTLFGASTISALMAKLRIRCNNNNEINNTGVPNWDGLMVGDYIDGLNLSGINSPGGSDPGDAPQAWSSVYENTRIVISGFNTYKDVGAPINTKNHILFTFANVITRGKVHNTSTFTSGYPATDLRIWLEGATGDGSGVFATKLKAALGGEYLYTISKLHAMGTTGAAWKNYTVWPPSEIEAFGAQTYGNDTPVSDTNKKLPIFTDNASRIKKWNGVAQIYWLMTTTTAGAFCNVNAGGLGGYHNPNYVYGVAPAFCVR